MWYSNKIQDFPLLFVRSFLTWRNIFVLHKMENCFYYVKYAAFTMTNKCQKTNIDFNR